MYPPVCNYLPQKNPACLHVLAVFSKFDGCKRKPMVMPVKKKLTTANSQNTLGSRDMPGVSNGTARQQTKVVL